jgi:hypothetical protein
MAGTWTSPSTQAAGATITNTIWNRDLTENMKAVGQPPRALAKLSVNQSIANNTETTLALASLDFSDQVNLSSNLLVITKAGVYLATLGVLWDANTTGTRYVYIRQNSVTNRGGSSMPAAPTGGVQTLQIVTCYLNCAVNDTIEGRVYQSSGGALNVNASAPTYLGCHLVSY